MINKQNLHIMTNKALGDLDKQIIDDLDSWLDDYLSDLFKTYAKRGLNEIRLSQVFIDLCKTTSTFYCDFERAVRPSYGKIIKILILNGYEITFDFDHKVTKRDSGIMPDAKISW